MSAHCCARARLRQIVRRTHELDAPAALKSSRFIAEKTRRETVDRALSVTPEPRTSTAGVIHSEDTARKKKGPKPMPRLAVAPRGGKSERKARGPAREVQRPGVGGLAG